MKKYTVRVRPEPALFLRHLHPLLKAKIRRALEELETDPYVGKPLREELQGLYSYRVSQYRIIYQIKQIEIQVEVIEIAERRIVYQRVAELLKKIH